MSSPAYDAHALGKQRGVDLCLDILKAALDEARTTEKHCIKEQRYGDAAREEAQVRCLRKLITQIKTKVKSES